MRLLILLTLALTACGERIDPQPQPGDVYPLPPVEWRVVGRPELERVYRESGMPLGERDRLHGFVGTHNGQWIVYTLPPSRVDDQATCTLGHEIMHIALGDYHD